MSSIKVKSIYQCVCLCACLFTGLVSAHVKNNLSCDIEQGKPLTNNNGEGVGPYNYQDPKDSYKTQVVLNNHFTSNVERLISGKTTRIEGDLDFALRHLPNHPRVLISMSRFYLQLKQKQKNINFLEAFANKNNLYTPDCYFKRAIYFQPNSVTSTILYAIDLHKNKRFSEAETFYLKAKKLDPKNPEIDYNTGLLYADLKNWEKATSYAQKAYRANYPLSGLKNKLAKQGIELSL